MNTKNIEKHLSKKIVDWLKHIDDEQIKSTIRANAVITGGAITSLLLGEKVNDYDVYFKTQDSAKEVAVYYVNKLKKITNTNSWVTETENGVKCTMSGKYFDSESGEYTIDEDVDLTDQILKDESDSREKYRPVYVTNNAITLSDGIQLIIRFVGNVDKLHENFDFVHCTCSYDIVIGKLSLSEKALECTLNKELIYTGSKYPICSMMRIRKFLVRGWTINAGQILKIAMQINKLDLFKKEVFADQLVGVDSVYFNSLIDKLDCNEQNTELVDSNRVIQLINEIF